MRCLLIILLCQTSYFAFGDEWNITKTKIYQVCRNTCVKDAQELGRIDFFSSKKKCNCFCKNSLSNITKQEMRFYELNNFFPKSFQKKRKKIYVKCFK